MGDQRRSKSLCRIATFTCKFWDCSGVTGCGLNSGGEWAQDYPGLLVNIPDPNESCILVWSKWSTFDVYHCVTTSSGSQPLKKASISGSTLLSPCPTWKASSLRLWGNRVAPHPFFLHEQWSLPKALWWREAAPPWGRNAIHHSVHRIPRLQSAGHRATTLGGLCEDLLLRFCSQTCTIHLQWSHGLACVPAWQPIARHGRDGWQHLGPFFEQQWLRLWI